MPAGQGLLGPRALLAIASGKLAGWLSRQLGRGAGSALPGAVAGWLDPGLTARLAARLADGVIVVTGTNGKTTTARMLTALFADHQLVANRSGANLRGGVLSSLLERSSPAGRMAADLAVLEVDEASMPAVCAQVRPRVIVVLNLFRDQLDRYGEVDRSESLIRAAVDGTPHARVVLCADDPLVAQLGAGAAPDRVRYFGIGRSRTRRAPEDHASDADRCPVCMRRLVFAPAFFSHIGHYRCPTCGFGRPTPFLELAECPADGPPDTADSMFALAVGAERVTGRLALPGLYNLYNAAAALTVGAVLGVAMSSAVDRLAGAAPAFGRQERVPVGGRDLDLLLVKNPVGFNQVIQTFLTGDPQPLLVAINDEAADGRDVSWLWDVTIEDIAARRPVVVTGVRAYDMAVRLKYAGLPYEVVPEIPAALDLLLARTPRGGRAYVLPTYTALLEVRKHLSDRGLVARWWV